MKYIKANINPISSTGLLNPFGEMIDSIQIRKTQTPDTFAGFETDAKNMNQNGLKIANKKSNFKKNAIATDTQKQKKSSTPNKVQGLENSSSEDLSPRISQGPSLFISYNDGSIMQYCTLTTRCIQNLPNPHKGEITTLVINKKSNTIFTSDSVDHHLREYCLRKYSLIKDYGIIHKGAITLMAISPDNADLFTAGSDNTLLQ